MFVTVVLLSSLLSTGTDWSTFSESNCIDCHAGPRAKGDLDLSQLATTDASLDDLLVWGRIRARLSAQDMPPRADKRPDPALYLAVLEHVESIIDVTAANHRWPGSPAGRRLNRTEWKNAVLDVIGVDVDVDAMLPTDEIGHGFDTVGDTLSLSPPLLERYIEAAEVAAAQAMQDLNAAVFVVERVEAPHLVVEGAGTKRGGTVHMHSRSTTFATFAIPRKAPYRIVAHAMGQQAGDEPVRFAVSVNQQRVGTLDVPATVATAYAIENQLPAGQVAIGLTFINDFYRPDHSDPSERDRNAAVTAIELHGPLDEPVYSALQNQFPREAPDKVRHADLRAFVSQVLPLLWRGQEDPGDVNRIVKLAWRQSDAWPARMRAAIVVMLSHPKFLLRLEPDPEDGALQRALTGQEIATRMAMMLWSSVPDKTLLGAAKSGDLDTSAGRQRQLHRMLVDPRAERLSQNFATQWLQVRRLRHAVPDPAMFPGVDGALRNSMLQETIDVFDRILREDHPWTDLLDAKETVVDATLARHYGLPSFPDGETRVVQRPGPACGVLQQAAILLSTSNPTRTSPVKRGKWVLEALLDAPPAPPPPGVDGLPKDGRPDDETSFRDLLLRHRSDPRCATCHERMDELGFAMERFNAVGQRREQADDQGHLPDGVLLDGPEGLRDWLLASGAVPRSLARHMLTYAVGRGFDVRDEAAIDAVTEHLRTEGRLWSLLEAVIESDPFLYRGGPS